MKQQYITLQDYLHTPLRQDMRHVWMVITILAGTLTLACGITLLVWLTGVEEVLYPGIAGIVFGIALPIAITTNVLYRKSYHTYLEHVEHFESLLSQHLTERYDIARINIFAENFIDWLQRLVKDGERIQANIAGTDLPILLTLYVTPEGNLEVVQPDVPLKN